MCQIWYAPTCFPTICPPNYRCHYFAQQLNWKLLFLNVHHLITVIYHQVKISKQKLFPQFVSCTNAYHNHKREIRNSKTLEKREKRDRRTKNICPTDKEFVCFVCHFMPNGFVLCEILHEQFFDLHKTPTVTYL